MRGEFFSMGTVVPASLEDMGSLHLREEWAELA